MVLVKIKFNKNNLPIIVVHATFSVDSILVMCF